MKLATFVVTMMLLLGSASVAAAECAWVLWVKNVEQEIEWEALAAFESRSKCIENVPSYIARMRALMDQVYAKDPPTKHFTARVEKHPGGYSLNMHLTKEELTAPYLEFTCFPDTLDPREKKE